MAAIVRFAVYSLLAGGTAMVLIIPELIILSYSVRRASSFQSR